MLEAINLTKKYEDGTVGLDHLTMTVAPGEVFSLVGADGAGKTTAIRLFLGFLLPTDGLARVNGVNVAENPLELCRCIAYIPSEMHLYPKLTGLENLGYFAALSGKDTYSIAELTALLHKAGIPPEAVHQPTTSYTRAMRQKVGIAVALAKRAQVLLLDDPTTYLSCEETQEFCGLVRTLASRGTAVLLATQNLNLARDYAQRMGILSHGKLLGTRNTSEMSLVDIQTICQGGC